MKPVLKRCKVPKYYDQDDSFLTSNFQYTPTCWNRSLKLLKQPGQKK